MAQEKVPEFDKYEIDRPSGAFEWLEARSEIIELIKDYLGKGGTLKAVHRCLVAEYQFPFSHSRLDAVIFRFMPRPKRV